MEEKKEKKEKLDIICVIKRLFIDYKKSINWFAFCIYYILFTVSVLLDGCSWYRFFCTTGVFIVLTLFVWLKYKMEIYERK